MLFLPTLLSALIGAVNGNTYSLNVNYICTDDISIDGICGSWHQTGTFQLETSCFPGDSVVITENGLKRMDAVQVGDMILGFDESTGKDVYTEMRAWLHRFPQMKHDYIKLNTEKGSLEVAREHHVAVLSKKDSPLEYRYGSEVTPGEYLWSRGGPVEVLTVTPALPNKGLYAPFTRLSNFYVGMNTSATFLAHSFAHVSYPTVLAPVVHGIMSVTELFSSNLHEVDHPTEYVHPVARRLQATFPSFLERPHKFEAQAVSGGSGNNNKDDQMATFFSGILAPNPVIFCSGRNCGA
jgi:hypothetical protein